MNIHTQVFASKSQMLDALALVQHISNCLEDRKSFRLLIGGGRTQEALNSRLTALRKPDLFWNRVFYLPE